MGFLTIAGGIYSSGTSDELTFITDIDGAYSSVSNHWHPSGDFLAAGLNTGGSNEITVYSWNGSALAVVETVDLGANIRSVEWHPNGNFLAVCSYISGAQVKVYSWNGTDTLTEVETVSYGAYADSVSWHPDGDFLALAGSNTSTELVVYSWNGTDTLASVETVNHAQYGYGVEWSHDGDYLAFAHGDGIVVYGWNGTDTLTSKDTASLGTWCKWLSWTSDDSYVALGGSSTTKTVAVYSFNGTTLTEKAYVGHGANHRASCQFDHSDSYLFSGSFINGSAATEKHIYMYAWDDSAFTLTEVSSQSWNGIGIFDSMLSPTDKYLASSVNRDANYAKTIRIDSTGLDITPTTWTANTNHNISGHILDIEYGSDGYWVICGVDSSGNGVIDYRQTDPTGTFTATSSGFGAADVHIVNYDGSTNWTAGADASLFRYKATPPSGSWASGTSVASGSIYALDYGNGYWCTGSSTAYLRYKTSVSGAWSDATTMSGAVRCIKYGSDGYWVAGSTSNNLKTASSTPIAWTNRTSTFGASDYVLGAEYNGTHWVITSNNGDIAYATDPTGTWVHVANPGPFVNGEWISGIAFGNGVWVICGSNGKLATATDPTSAGNWTQQTIGFGTVYTDSVEYGNGYWVVGGYGTPGKLAYSQVTV